MSHRMSVLSRRLGRFAVGFTVATFAFFFIGFYASANNKGQIVFFCAGLVLVCLFASFLLWLAHGFAWAMIPDKPAEARKPVEELKPAEAPKPAETMKPAEALKPLVLEKPAETMKPLVWEKPAETMKPLVWEKPAEAIKPVEEKKAVEAMKAAEEKKPVEAIKPVEEKVTAPEEDPPDAQYTITGRRIR